MKLQALMIAVALAAGSTLALAANEGNGMGSNGASAATSDASAMHAKHMKKVVAKHHRHHRHHLHARAEMRSSTRSMGAGRYSPSVDLNSASRERRMDSAYNDWLRTQRR